MRGRALIIVAASAVAVACFDGLYTGPQGIAGNPPRRDSGVVVEDSILIGAVRFFPDTAQVLVGTVVTWTNIDTTIHSVTSFPGSSEPFDSGDVAPNDSSVFQHAFARTGTYGYYCRVHGTPTSGHRGVVIVK